MKTNLLEGQVADSHAAFMADIVIYELLRALPDAELVETAVLHSPRNGLEPREGICAIQVHRDRLLGPIDIRVPVQVEQALVLEGALELAESREEIEGIGIGRMECAAQIVAAVQVE